MSAIDQKRIAKNTMLLYVRMIVVMLVGLYTSRVVLDALGKEFFGIYDAVGSIVMMVTFISETMMAACQRWYAFEMVKNNQKELNRTFCISFTVFFVITIIVAMLAETVGCWFLENKMDVSGHMAAAKMVFHFSVISFCIQILRFPYQGMVVAKEKMKVYAYLSMVEVMVNLSIAFVLAHTADIKEDRLILYAAMMVGSQLLISVFYWAYCRLFYVECRYRFVFDMLKFKEMFSFAGWNMLGSFADVCKNYGLGILINVTFGPIASAARAIANKVYYTVRQLNANFFSAVRPQLVKSYAAGEMTEMRNLICQSSRISFFLLFLAALPILLETDFILPVWLRGRNVPDESYIFTRLLIIECLLNTFVSPMASSIQATGKVRNYQIVIGLTLMLVLPVAYLGIRWFDFPAESVFMVSIVITLIAHVFRILFVKKQIGLQISDYLKNTILPVAAVTLVSLMLSLAFKHFCYSILKDSQIVKSLCVILASIMFAGLTALFLGMTQSERKNILKMITNIVRSKKE